VQRWLWEAAKRLLPARGSGEFNQALMELGALVCTPAQPSCLLCPMTRFCTAHAKGLQNRIPPKAKAPPNTTVREVAVVVRKGNRVLLVQRPADASRWANMWEFPHGPAIDGESDTAAARRIVSELLGIRTISLHKETTIRHGITRFQITMVCYTAKYAAGRFCSAFYAHAAWTTHERLAAFALSSPQRRLAATLQAQSASEASSRK
jgi:A/G-specific adenine glycosylase